MELCSQSKKVLASLAGGNLSDKAFKDIITNSLEVFTQEKSDEALKNIANKHGIDDIYLKNIVSALSILYFEAAKHDASESEISNLLEDVSQLSADQISLMTAAYSYKAPQLRAVLGSGGFRLPYLKDVTWRVDHVYEGKEGDKPSLPKFTIGLSLEPQVNVHQQLQISCTLEAMQDMVAKLQDMVKQAERLNETQ
eukprot:NODE_7592_length_761_cov_32.336991_g6979_i0.p1 GENE.NODE_7592_length_761_cov_32.336991_g6979_i0~~NODE_7592_length_761_cov_32.336991_g6979_i0.p1  ORF type:complete len:196 (+),score=29.45 NODE_7592_length_761_cov_32.336991_g6979_i0:80-667(+)